MMQNWKAILWILGVGIAAALFVVWLVYFNAPEPAPTTPQEPLGSGSNVVPVTPGLDNDPETLPTITSSGQQGKIFKLSDGPVAGATLIETVRPTSTLARFVMQTNGHTFDLVLDSPGAVPKTISNVTIPGIAQVLWGPTGRTALVRYLDGAAAKTASLALPAAAATTTAPTRVQFLPADILSLALSPDGARAAYLISSSAGADGYIADANGGNARRAFSLPLRQVQLSWPSQGTLLAVTSAAAGAPGAAFSVYAASGAVAPLLFAPGLTAVADRSLSTLVYQTAGETKATYAYNIASGTSRPVSFDPLPQQCSWSTSLLFCIVAMQYTAPSYLDLFNKGQSSVTSGISATNASTGRSQLVAIPGEDGGEAADIVEIAVSPNQTYLLYITRGDRSLWAVRLK